MHGFAAEDDTKPEEEKTGSSKRVRSTSTTPIVINNTCHISGDSDHIVRTIKERSSEVATQVHRELKDRLERLAVV